MSVKKEEIVNTKLSAKGILRAIDSEGFHVEDEKSEEIECLTLDDINTLLLNKSVTISFASKEEVD